MRSERPNHQPAPDAAEALSLPYGFYRRRASGAGCWAMNTLRGRTLIGHLLISLTVLGCSQRNQDSTTRSDAELRSSLPGTWSSHLSGPAGGRVTLIMTMSPIGHYVMRSTDVESSGTLEGRWEGDFEVKQGLLILKTTDAPTNATPLSRPSSARILKVNSTELLLEMKKGGTPVTFRK